MNLFSLWRVGWKHIFSPTKQTNFQEDKLCKNGPTLLILQSSRKDNCLKIFMNEEWFYFSYNEFAKFASYVFLICSRSKIMKNSIFRKIDIIVKTGKTWWSNIVQLGFIFEMGFILDYLSWITCYSNCCKLDMLNSTHPSLSAKPS